MNTAAHIYRSDLYRGNFFDEIEVQDASSVVIVFKQHLLLIDLRIGIMYSLMSDLFVIRVCRVKEWSVPVYMYQPVQTYGIIFYAAREGFANTRHLVSLAGCITAPVIELTGEVVFSSR